MCERERVCVCVRECVREREFARSKYGMRYDIYGTHINVYRNTI